MEFTFLGTSSGVPTRARNVTALAVRPGRGKRWILIDCGEATQHRLLLTPFSLADLAAILITHVHGDHLFGLPGLLASAAMGGRTAPLWIAGPPEVSRFVEASLSYSRSTLPFALHFLETRDTIELYRNIDIEIEAWPLSHRVPSHGFSLMSEPGPWRLDIDRLERDGVERGPLWGRIVREPEVALSDGRVIRSADYRLPPAPRHKMVVGGDNDTPALLEKACNGASVLVHEATYSEADATRLGKRGHSTAGEVATFAAAMGIPNLVLTHFSPRYGDAPEDSGAGIDVLRREAADRYDGNLFLANDLDSFVLNREEILSRSAR